MKKKWQNTSAVVTTENVWGENHSFRHVTGHLATETYMTGHLATGYDQLPSKWVSKTTIYLGTGWLPGNK